MDRETGQQFAIVTQNQQTIQREIRDLNAKLDQIVAILRGIEDELKRQRR